MEIEGCERNFKGFFLKTGRYPVFYNYGEQNNIIPFPVR